MKIPPVLVATACIAAATLAADAQTEVDPAIRESFNRQVDLYIKTTKEDLAAAGRLARPAVTLLFSDIRKSESLVTPWKGMVKYLVEYDSATGNGIRETHPYLMQCSYFDGLWDINPHGHKSGRNVKDLDLKRTKMLFPNE